MRQDGAGGEPRGRALGALAHGVVDEIAGLALHGHGGRHDRLDHGADGARQLGVLGGDIARGHHRPAPLVTEHDDERRSEVLGAVLDGAHGDRIDHVAGIARDEQLAGAHAAEQQLGSSTAVGAADDDRPRRLAGGDIGAALGQVHHAGLRARDVARVAFLQGRQGLIGREGGFLCLCRHDRPYIEPKAHCGRTEPRQRQ